MKILYEDNHIIAVDKPALLLTQPSDREQESVEEQIKALIKVRDHKSGGVFVHAVHRLDRETSGIVIFAKTSKALSRLSQQLRERTVIKEYCALVSGPRPESGVYVDCLVHDNHRARVDKSGKRAELEVTEVEPFDGLWQVRVRLVTGRYHQIRAQLSTRGNAIVGDCKYGSDRPFSGIALHHERCVFIHPTQKLSCEIYSPLSWGMKGKSSR